MNYSVFSQTLRTCDVIATGLPVLMGNIFTFASLTVTPAGGLGQWRQAPAQLRAVTSAGNGPTVVVLDQVADLLDALWDGLERNGQVLLNEGQFRVYLVYLQAHLALVATTAVIACTELDSETSRSGEAQAARSQFERLLGYPPVGTELALAQQAIALAGRVRLHC